MAGKGVGERLRGLGLYDDERQALTSTPSGVGSAQTVEPDVGLATTVTSPAPAPQATEVPSRSRLPANAGDVLKQIAAIDQQLNNLPRGLISPGQAVGAQEKQVESLVQQRRDLLSSVGLDDATLDRAIQNYLTVTIGGTGGTQPTGYGMTRSGLLTPEQVEKYADMTPEQMMEANPRLARSTPASSLGEFRSGVSAAYRAEEAATEASSTAAVNQALQEAKGQAEDMAKSGDSVGAKQVLDTAVSQLAKVYGGARVNAGITRVFPTTAEARTATPTEATVRVVSIGTVTPDEIQAGVYPKGIQVGDKIATTETGEVVKVGDADTSLASLREVSQIRAADATQNNLARLTETERRESQRTEIARREVAEFEAKHILLPSGEWLTVEDWNELPAKYQRMALQGATVSDVNRAVDFDNEAVQRSVTEAEAEQAARAAPTIMPLESDEPELMTAKEFLSQAWGKLGAIVTSFRSREGAKKALSEEIGPVPIGRAVVRLSKQVVDSVKANPSRFIVSAVETFMPGVYTAGHWREMTTTERLASVTLDTAIAGGMLISWAAMAPYGSVSRGFSKAVPKVVSSAAKDASAAERAAIRELSQHLTLKETKAVKSVTTSIRKALASGSADDLIEASEQVRGLPSATNGKIGAGAADDLSDKLARNAVDSLKAQDAAYTEWLKRNPTSKKRTVVEELQRVNKRQIKTLTAEKPKVILEEYKVAEPGKYVPAKVSPAEKPVVRAPAVAPVRVAPVPVSGMVSPRYVPRASPARVVPAGRGIPSEAYGRMTPEQVARIYGEDARDDYLEVIGKPIAGTGMRVISRGSVSTTIDEGTSTRIAEATQAAIREAERVAVQESTKTLSKTQTQTRVRSAAKEAVQERLATELQTLPKEQIKATIRAAVKLATKLAEPKTREQRTKKLQGKLVTIVPGGDGERKAVLPYGAATWRQGFTWKWIPPELVGKINVRPYSLPRGVTPRGARITGRTPAETIQLVGGGTMPTISVNLGKVNVYVAENASSISFGGKGEMDDVGTMGSTTVGMSSPAKGHAYAADYYPQHSVSRTAISTGNVNRKTRGINRPEALAGLQTSEEPQLEMLSLRSLSPPPAAGAIRTSVRKVTGRAKLSGRRPRRTSRTTAEPTMGGIRL